MSVHPGEPDDRAVDAGVVEREPELPALHVLLDDGLLTSVLRSANRLRARETARVDRLRLKPGVRAQAAARVEPTGRWLLLNAYSIRAWPKAAKDVLAASRRGHAAWTDDTLLLVVSPVAADRDLPVPPGLRPDEDAGHVRVATLAHNPARRWVGAVTGRPDGSPPLPVEPRAVLKIHADAGAGQRAVTAAAVLASSGLCTPREARLTPDVLIRPWVSGRHPEPSSPVAGDALAEVLARLARARVAGAIAGHLPRLTRRGILDRVSVAGDALAVVQPAAQQRARRVLAALERDLAGLDGEPVLVHGDLSADQVLLAARGVVLLDLDRAGTGPAGWDAACWIASQAACGIPVEGLSPVPGHPVPGDLLAAAAILYAPEPWRRRRRGHAAATSALLDLAEAALSPAAPRAVPR